MIDVNHRKISISKQCEMLGLSRSTLYYKTSPMSRNDIKVMHEIDKIYTKYPFYGSRKITKELNTCGIEIGRDKTRTFMRLMGLEAIYPKPNLSKPNVEHKIYPYLLRNKKTKPLWTGSPEVRRSKTGSLTRHRKRHGFTSKPSLPWLGCLS